MYSQVNYTGLFDVLAVLLEWTSETHLQKMPTFQDSPQGRLQEQQLDFPSALVHEKCLKVSLLAVSTLAKIGTRFLITLFSFPFTQVNV